MMHEWSDYLDAATSDGKVVVRNFRKAILISSMRALWYSCVFVGKRTVFS